MTFAIVESQTVQRSIATVTAEVKHVEANVIARIATIAQASQIWRKTQIQSQKRRLNSSDSFIFFIELDQKEADL
jgi:hypothetical protein